jgi:hypothetical protein
MTAETTAADHPHDAELISASAAVIAGLIRAIEHKDMPELAVQIGRLLNAVTKYTNAVRPKDAALQRAVGHTWR